MVTTAMLRQLITSISQSQILTGMEFKAERPVSSFAIGIWRNTRQLAAAKLGCINTLLIRLKPTALFIFLMDLDLCQLRKQAHTSCSIVVSS